MLGWVARTRAPVQVEEGGGGVGVGLEGRGVRGEVEVLRPLELARPQVKDDEPAGHVLAGVDPCNVLCVLRVLVVLPIERREEGRGGEGRGGGGGEGI